MAFPSVMGSRTLAAGLAKTTYGSVMDGMKVVMVNALSGIRGVLGLPAERRQCQWGSHRQSRCSSYTFARGPTSYDAAPDGPRRETSRGTPCKPAGTSITTPAILHPQPQDDRVANFFQFFLLDARSGIYLPPERLSSKALQFRCWDSLTSGIGVSQ